MNISHLFGSRRATVATAAVAGAALVTGLSLSMSGALDSGAAGSSHATALHRTATVGSTCSGPTGAAYIAEPGYSAFGAVDTADCDVVQTYNSGDTPVQGFTDDTNYSSSTEGVALHGSTLYFANPGVVGAVSEIDAATLNPSDYSPSETLIHVGVNPTALAVTPDGKYLWVAVTGPQTPSFPNGVGVAVVNTGSGHVGRILPVSGSPTWVSMNPTGSRAFVTTSKGLFVFDTHTRQIVRFVPGLGNPNSSAVSPDGNWVYVTETDEHAVAVIDAHTLRVVKTVQTGGENPWQIAVSANSQRVFVTDPDSNRVSYFAGGMAAPAMASTFSVPGVPTSIAITPDGSEIWVGEESLSSIAVVNSSTLKMTAQFNVGGYPQSGDGSECSQILLTSTPTPQGSSSGG